MRIGAHAWDATEWFFGSLPPGDNLLKGLLTMNGLSLMPWRKTPSFCCTLDNNLNLFEAVLRRTFREVNVKMPLFHLISVALG